MTKINKMLPKWQNFAKSGHTDIKTLLNILSRFETCFDLRYNKFKESNNLDKQKLNFGHISIIPLRFPQHVSLATSVTRWLYYFSIFGHLQQ